MRKLYSGARRAAERPHVTTSATASAGSVPPVDPARKYAAAPATHPHIPGSAKPPRRGLPAGVERGDVHRPPQEEEVREENAADGNEEAPEEEHEVRVAFEQPGERERRAPIPPIAQTDARSFAEGTRLFQARADM